MSSANFILLLCVVVFQAYLVRLVLNQRAASLLFKKDISKELGEHKKMISSQYDKEIERSMNEKKIVIQSESNGKALSKTNELISDLWNDRFLNTPRDEEFVKVMEDTIVLAVEDPLVQLQGDYKLTLESEEDHAKD